MTKKRTFPGRRFTNQKITRGKKSVQKKKTNSLSASAGRRISVAESDGCSTRGLKICVVNADLLLLVNFGDDDCNRRNQNTTCKTYIE